MTPLTLIFACYASGAMSAPILSPELALENAKQSYVLAKQTYETDKSKESLEEYRDAAMEYGEMILNAGHLPPKDKYPPSLRAFREVLILEPNNPIAQNRIELIEGIYESMGRPIPE